MARSRKQVVNPSEVVAEEVITTTTKTTSTTSSRAHSPSAPESERPTGPLSIPVPASERDVVKVNRYNATELKNACDDAVKRYLSRPELFKQNHIHTDVRLALGWLSVFVAAGTALYGYKVDFEQSKPVVTIGLVVYIILTAFQTLYSFFVEGNILFIGKRKTFSKRIISERIQINAATVESPDIYLSKSLSPTNAPFYHLTISYVRSTNGGKSLLAKGRMKGGLPYSTWFDDQGILDQEGFEHWVGELVEQAMDGKYSM